MFGVMSSNNLMFILNFNFTLLYLLLFFLYWAKIQNDTSVSSWLISPYQGAALHLKFINILLYCFNFLKTGFPRSHGSTLSGALRGRPSGYLLSCVSRISFDIKQSRISGLLRCPVTLMNQEKVRKTKRPVAGSEADAGSKIITLMCYWLITWLAGSDQKRIGSLLPTLG